MNDEREKDVGMARRQQWEERERWPESEREDGWSEADERRRWPQVHTEDHDEIRPIVNPYAVVALVAALLALFPVAIVFGLIAFGHPRGKGMASLALLLGLTEVAAVVAFVALSGNSLTDRLDGAEPVAAQTVPATAATTNSAAVNSAATNTSAQPPAPLTTQLAARKAASCPETQLGAIGQSAEGTTLLCLSVAGSTDGYQWSGPYNVGTGQFEPGTRCDPSVSKTGRTTEGRALVCEGAGRGGSWVRWTE